MRVKVERHTILKDSLGEGPEAQQLSLEQSFQDRLDGVARLLHDDILQTFATCLLKAQYCEKLAQLERYDLMKRELTLLEDTLSNAIDSVRELVATLRGPDDQAGAQ
ncbi:MAG: histidine kinase [Dehalococcoidia bacterium]|nr:histidine kinase [Dehalococcoidia bacterium]